MTWNIVVSVRSDGQAYQEAARWRAKYGLYPRGMKENNARQARGGAFSRFFQEYYQLYENLLKSRHLIGLFPLWLRFIPVGVALLRLPSSSLARSKESSIILSPF